MDIKRLKDVNFNEPLLHSKKRQRLEAFAKTHNLVDKYPIKELSRWHMILTNSCASGREAFAQKHNLDLKDGMLTIPEFIELVKEDWGSEDIKNLEHLMKAINEDIKI